MRAMVSQTQDLRSCSECIESEAHIPPQQCQDSSIGPSDAVDSQAEGIAEDDAAVTVQKVYRSYRTRRQLADCAVMNKNYAWWNVLEGVLLHQRSEAFYAYNSQDTAVSRWTRLRKKAAKVGKGLSQDENARKLAIQHWLEAIDPRHRYGHNLNFYYDAWEKSSTKEPFFYWLDIGEGKDVEVSSCKRSKLQKQQIKYLGPTEREEYEVVVEGGKLWYKKSEELVNTPKGDKWIFVMSAAGKLYVAQKQKGTFQHSSFLAGGAAKAAGRLLVNHGTLELMEAHSGHYRPTQENFSCLVKVLEDLGTDFSMAKVQAVSDDMLQKSPSGRGVELNEAEEFVAKGVIVTESTNGPGQLAGTEGITKGMLKMEDNIVENGTICNRREASVYGLQVRVLDRKASKISAPVDGESAEDLNTAPLDTLKMKEALKGGLKKEAADIAKLLLVPPENSEGALKWCSEAGPRIVSLADVPSEMLAKVF